MSITVAEKNASRRFRTGPGAYEQTRTYVVRGADFDEDGHDALDAALGHVDTPETVNGHPVRTTEVVEVHAEEGEGRMWHEVTIGWASGGSQSGFSGDPGSVRDSFDTTGGVIRVTQSRSTRSSHAAPGAGDAPDYGGAIGVTDQGVEGVDIIAPQATLVRNKVWSAAAVNDAYIDAVLQLTGRVNNATALGKPEGELLFLGASGSQRADGAWEVAYRFGYSKNKVDVAVGEMTISAVEGWEYLWTRHAPELDATAGVQALRPRYAYVERVYEKGNFATLGIE